MRRDARSRRRGWLPAGGERLELTPMIDVTFLLLVFFLCTLEFRTLDLKLSAHLPRDAGAGPRQDVPIERLEVELCVEAGAQDATRRLLYRVGSRGTRSAAELDGWLRAARAQDPDARVVIAAGGDVRHGEVVALLDRLVRLGFGSIGFAPAPAPGRAGR